MKGCNLPGLHSKHGLCIAISLMSTIFSLSALAAPESPKLPEGMVTAIRTAMQTHPEVMAADAEMLAARAQVGAGDYRWYPKAEVAMRTGERGDRYSTVGLNQTLWDNGKINADYEAVKAGERGAISGKSAVIRSVGMDAATAYLNVARAREQKKVAEDNVNEHKTLFESVLKRNGSGIGSKSDVSLTASRLQQARSIAEHWQGEVLRAEAAYLAIVGQPVGVNDFSAVAPWDVAGGKDGMIANVVASAPSLQKLREEVKVAEATVLSKRAQLFPTLYARVDNTRYYGSGPFDDDTRFSVNFQWQNDVMLSQRYQVEAAQHKVTAVQRAVESEERNLVQAANNYWADYRTALNRSVELAKFSETAAETVRLFKRQFTIGRRSWPEVTNTLQDLYSARSQKVEAKYAAIIARVRMAFVAGEMDRLFNAGDDRQLAESGQAPVIINKPQP